MSSVDPNELSEEELEERRQRLKDAVEEEAEQLEESEENALEALSIAAEENEDVHEVELTGGIEVEVKDSLPGRLEKKAASIQEDDVEAAVGSIAEVMAELIETEGYNSKLVWIEYHDEYGMSNLMECAMTVTDPYYSRQEELQDQRSFRGER